MTEDIFSNAALSLFKKQNKQKDELIDNLKGSVVKLESKLSAMHKAIQNSKLQFFVAKSDSKKKAKVIVNPFADNPLADSAVPEKDDEDRASEEHSEHNDRLNDLQENLEDICDSAVQLIAELSGNQVTPKVKDRSEYIVQTRRLFQRVFGTIKEITSEVKSINNEDLVIDYENFDLETLKSKLESKLRSVVSYISKIRDNSDFFNNDVDGQIISA